MEERRFQRRVISSRKGYAALKGRSSTVFQVDNDKWNYETRPRGTLYNSLTFQRRVVIKDILSPGGTTELAAIPTGLHRSLSYPALEALGFYQPPQWG
ncbi:MAG: hypothetical protein JWN74_1913 [Acidobacteriaceae bacterium]|nr:hypothetical protein [Acidobacteriaceae bacterium]